MINPEVAILKTTMTISGVILSILMAGNVFFVKRLVDQLDSTREIVWQLRQDVVILKIAVDNLSNHPAFSFRKGE